MNKLLVLPLVALMSVATVSHARDYYEESKGSRYQSSDPVYDMNHSRANGARNDDYIRSYRQPSEETRSNGRGSYSDRNQINDNGLIINKSN